MEHEWLPEESLNGTLANLFLRSTIITALRLPYTFRWTIFFKSGFLGQNIGRNVISNLKKKIIEKD